MLPFQHNFFHENQTPTAHKQMYLQQGKLTLDKLCRKESYVERSPQDTARDGFDLYSAQDSFAWPRADLALPLRRDNFRPLWIICFEFVKV